MSKSKRVAKVKRSRSKRIERLTQDTVRDDGSIRKGGLTVINKGDNFKRSVCRIFIPTDNIPPEVLAKVTEREIKEPDGSVKTVQLRQVREDETDTEYYVSPTIFTVEFHSNKFARKAFRDFCKRENIYFKDVPIDLQDWLDRKRLQGRCRVCDIVGYHQEVADYLEQPAGEAPILVKKDNNPDRPKIKQGYTICISFSGINETLRLKLMAESWVRASYTIRTRTPSNSSMLHRLGERLKHKKKYMFEKQEERNAFRSLEESFVRNRQAAGHRSNKQVYDKLFKKDDNGKNYFTK